MSKGFRVALLTVAAGLLAFQLFVPPVLGVADNGDFGKLSYHACIGPERTRPYPQFEYFTPRYAVGPEYCGSIVPTSGVLPLYASAGLARLVMPAGSFDLRVLGAVYAALFLGAYWVLLSTLGTARPVAREAVAVAALLVFFGAVYVPMFNSFATDAAALVFLAWAVVLGIRVLFRPEVRLWEYAAFTVALILLATSKAQHAFLPFCFIPILLSGFNRHIFPARWIRSAATIAVLAATALFLRAGTAWYTAITVYGGIFYKFLPACDDPHAEFRKLGLDPMFESHIGKHSYSEGSHMQEKAFAEAFLRQFPTSHLVAFALTHPKADLRILRHDLDEASLERVRMRMGGRVYRLGNYEQSAGHPPEAQSAFLTPWSRAKLLLFGGRAWVYLAYILGLVSVLWAAALREAKYRRQAIVAAAVVTGVLPLSFGPPFLDGLDAGRHLFLFNCLLDMCACGALYTVLRWRARA